MNNIIKNNLEKELKIPVSFRHYEGKEDTYITFFEYLNQGEQFADDEEIGTGRYYQIDIWSKKNYTDLVKKTEEILKEIGFMKRSQADAPYEVETGFFHKILRYVYREEK